MKQARQKAPEQDKETAHAPKAGANVKEPQADAANGDASLPFLDPHIRLFGEVNEDMFATFIDRLGELRKEMKPEEPILLCLTTTGGQADTGRRIADEIKLVRRLEKRALRFVGKSAVYSAGITIMSAFKPQHRFLTAQTELLIHERHIEMKVELSGGLRGNMDRVRDIMAQMESGTRLESDGFRDLVDGSRCTLDALLAKVLQKDWYLTAEEALEQGLIAKVI